jgi:RNA polymerase sigma-70 factor (ECF subfamily)
MSQEGLEVGALYQRYGPMVFRRVLAFYPAQEAEEVLQEVFLQVLEKIETFRSEASPGTWLYRLTTNHCINRRRNQGRRSALWRAHGGELWGGAAVGASQEPALLLQEVWERLPEELLQVGTYYYLDGMTHAEIARVLGVSRRTVGNRLEELTARVAKFSEGGR